MKIQDPDQRPWTLSARWVFPVASPPIPGGSVTIQGEKILAVEPAGSRRADHHFDDAAILPGFVNAHAHLDLSGLAGRLSGSGDFTEWLTAVTQFRRTQSAEDIRQATAAGLEEVCRSGATVVGDISALGLSWQLLAKAPIHGVVFYELLGLTAARSRSSWAGFCQWLRQLPDSASCRPGVSPHAPYSVRGSLFLAAARLAQQWKLPLSVHTAETKAELELLAERTGTFRTFLEKLSVWDPAGLCSGVDELLRVLDGIEHASLVHANYLQPESLAAGSKVIYCPRTHAYFRHSTYPLRDFLARGVTIALGTDSLASNPDLNILEEGRFVHESFPDIPGDVILEMLTSSGALALGWHSVTGSLEPGKFADLVVLSLPGKDAVDPHESLFGRENSIRQVFWRGRPRGETNLRMPV